MPSRRFVDPGDVLTDELATILQWGPWRVGKLLKDLPDHDRVLRPLWRRHGARLTAEMPRGQQPWFIDRDWFIRVVRGEPEEE